MYNLCEDISKYRTFLMGVSIFTIMLFHQNWVHLPPFNAFHIWGHYGVDVFLFVSGFGLAFSLSKNAIRVFYKNRLFRLFPLCLFCGICKYIIYCFSNNIISDIDGISYLTIFGLDLWFIQTIWAFYLLSPLFFYVIKRYDTILLTILVVSCLYTIIVIPDVKNTFIGGINRLPVFVLGMMFQVKKWRISYRILIPSFSFLLMAMLATLSTTKDVFHFGNDLWMYPILAFGMPALVLVMCMFVKKLPHGIAHIFKSLGNHSLELYLWHEFVFACLWVSLNSYVNRCFNFFLAFSLSILLAYLSSTIVNILMRFLGWKSKT